MKSVIYDAKLFLTIFLLNIWLPDVSHATYLDKHVIQNRGAFVNLFEWRWKDIAEECERFFAKSHYGAIQVSPPMEHAIIEEEVIKQPWWQRYQPVSYKLVSRSGNETEFKDMIDRCHRSGISVYVDAVINHMTGSSSGIGSAGTSYNGTKYEYPGVPYKSDDFTKSICKDSKDPLCYLRFLNLTRPNVEDKIVEYLNNFISLGVAGFRIGALGLSKSVNFLNIYKRLDNLKSSYFPSNSKPYIFHELADYSDEVLQDYMNGTAVSDFKYGYTLGKIADKKALSLSDLRKFSIDWNNVIPSDHAVVFTDNHDSQRELACTDDILTFRNPKAYKIGNVFGLARPYGYFRVMSGYKWSLNCDGRTDRNGWFGPPHLSNFKTLPVTILPDGKCGNSWNCEHRWQAINNMVTFRNVVGDAPVGNWWDNERNQIAFSRGNVGFVVINNDYVSLEKNLFTRLPPGEYCDIISGNYENGRCTGKTISVDSDGNASFNISNTDEEPMMATHVKAKVTVENRTTTGPLTTDVQLSTVKVTTESVKVTTESVNVTTESVKVTTESVKYDFQRTVVFVEEETEFGHHVFLSGGTRSRSTTDCKRTPNEVNCGIRIRYRKMKGTASFNVWKVGDNYLDWFGKESNQTGVFEGQPAYGTPMMYTTNVKSDQYYNPLNVYGSHYWMLDVDMDCTKTEDGWFEAKALYDHYWENDVTQEKQCKGNASAKTPFKTHNHVLKCGKINVVHFNSGFCLINDF